MYSGTATPLRMHEPTSAGDAKDEVEEPLISNSYTELFAGNDSMCSREHAKDAEQEPEEIVDEAVRRYSPRCFTRSQCKTKTFSYPGPIMPSDD
jgi:hypothetical protein